MFLIRTFKKSILINSILLLVAIATQAQYTLKLNDVEFNIATGTITNYLNTTEKDIVIPSSFIVDGEEVTVTKIDNEAFRSKVLRKVVLPTKISHIGHRAFSDNLIEEIIIPRSIVYIGVSAFMQNKLKIVTFEENSLLLTLEYYAFDKNADLKEIILPTNKNESFLKYKDISLKTLDPGSSLIDFRNIYFAYIQNPHILTLDDVVFNKTTGEIIKYKYRTHKNIIIPPNFIIKGQSVAIKSIKVAAFYDKLLTSVKISEGIEYIGYSAFRKNFLNSINIPSSVRTIGKMAFDNNNLASVTFEENSNLNTIGGLAFSSNPRLNSFKLPTNTNTDFVYYYDDLGNQFSEGSLIEDYNATYFLPYTLTLNDVVFDSTTGTITDYINTNNKNIVIPESFNINGIDVYVNVIGKEAFYSKDLFYVGLNANLLKISEDSFSKNNLTNITIPSYVTYIDRYAFMSNSKLYSVKIEENSRLVFVGGLAFDIESITFPNNVTPGFSFYKDNRGNSYNPKDVSLSIAAVSYFVPDAYLIRYNLNGGRNSAQNPTAYITTHGISSFEPATKENHEFVGWFTDANFSTQIESIEVGLEEDIELHAKFDVVNDINTTTLESKNNFNVYPNPAVEQISLVGYKKDEMLSIYNLSGALVKKQLNRNNNLDISNLQNGIYYLQNEQGETVKFVKR